MAECLRCGKAEGPPLRMKILCNDCAHTSVTKLLDPEQLVARLFEEEPGKGAWWEL